MVYFKLHLWQQVLIGLLLGLGFGVLLSPELSTLSEEMRHTIVSWIAVPGHLFLALIKMIVLPLILVSVTLGVAAGKENLQILGPRVLFYFVCTTCVAITVGLLFVNFIEPGSYIAKDAVENLDVSKLNNAQPLWGDGVKGVIYGLVPSNPFAALTQGAMLQVVIFAAIMGAALAHLKRKESRIVIDVLEGVQDACMVVVGAVLKLAGLAVMGLIAEAVVKLGFASIFSMGAYMLTVAGGLFMMFVIYLLIATFIGGRHLTTYLRAIRDPLLLAFSTSSSAATMPVTLKTAEEKLQIKEEVRSFVIPLGTTINMDGTALYQAVATVFLAQVFGVELGFSEMLMILVTTVAASIGTPGTPGVGLVILATILDSVGVPASGIALIIGVDRLLDMLRTAVNVSGDLTAATVMNRWMKNKL